MSKDKKKLTNEQAKKIQAKLDAQKAAIANTRAIAVEAHKQGLMPIRILADGSKAPFDKWGDLRRMENDKGEPVGRPSEAAIRSRFNREYGIGILTGPISDGYLTIDLDEPELREAYEEAVGPDLIAKMVIVKTPREGGGRQYLCKTDLTVGIEVLAMRKVPVNDADGNPRLKKDGTQVTKPKTLIETRPYGIIPGSSVNTHRLRRPYTYEQGSIGALVRITDEETNRLLDAARGLTEVEVKERTKVDFTPCADPSSPGNDYAAQTSWEEILEPEGWQLDECGNPRYVYRPGKDKGEGHAGTVGRVSSEGNDLLDVYSTNAWPFSIDMEDGHAQFTKFAAYTALRNPDLYESDKKEAFKQATKALAKAGYGFDDDQTVTIAARDNDSVIAQSISRAFAATGHVYDRNESVTVIREPESGTTTRAITRYDEVWGAMSDFGFNIMLEGKKGFGPIPRLPQEAAKSWLQRQNKSLPKISCYTESPVYDENWNLAKPGYNRASGIYYAGRAVRPRKGTEHIDAMLQDFCWSSDVDRVNFVGMMLSTLLANRFMGSKPMALLRANQAGSGKTKLGLILARLRTANKVDTTGFPAREEEVAKVITTLAREGRCYVLWDNVRRELKSAALDEALTAPTYGGRVLGSSVSVRAENSITWITTLNSDVEVDGELAKRCCTIDLHYQGGEADERTGFKIADPVIYAKRNREAILAELIGMIAKWREKGAPRGKAVGRFGPFTEVIGGILEANGHTGFMTNFTEAKSEGRDAIDFTEMCNKILYSHFDRGFPKLPASRLLDRCKHQGGMFAKIEQQEVSTPIKARRLTETLSKFVGQSLQVTTDNKPFDAVFRSRVDRKGIRQFWLEPQDGEYDVQTLANEVLTGRGRGLSHPRMTAAEILDQCGSLNLFWQIRNHEGCGPKAKAKMLSETLQQWVGSDVEISLLADEWDEDFLTDVTLQSGETREGTLQFWLA